MTESAAGGWLKGGTRYAKLKEVVPEYLAPEAVEAFFVAVAEKVFVLGLKLPGVFRAKIGKLIYEARRATSAVTWDNGKVIIDNTGYWPISFHGDDVRELVSLLSTR